MNKIETMAYRWWKGGRPVGWSELAHLENPTINKYYASDKNLAKEVAKLVRTQYNKDGTKKAKA